MYMYILVSVNKLVYLIKMILMFDTFYKSFIMKFLIDLHLIQPDVNLYY